MTEKMEGRCRYCGSPKPVGYAVTCGRSECQEAAYKDKERRQAPPTRRPRKDGRRG